MALLFTLIPEEREAPRLREIQAAAEMETLLPTVVESVASQAMDPILIWSQSSGSVHHLHDARQTGPYIIFWTSWASYEPEPRRARSTGKPSQHPRAGSGRGKEFPALGSRASPRPWVGLWHERVGGTGHETEGRWAGAEAKRRRGVEQPRTLGGRTGVYMLGSR